MVSISSCEFLLLLLACCCRCPYMLLLANFVSSCCCYYPWFCWCPHCVGAPIVAFVPAFGCFPATAYVPVVAGIPAVSAVPGIVGVPTVPFVPAVIGIPDVADIPAVAVVLAVASVPAVPVFCILAGVYTYCTVQWDIQDHWTWKTTIGIFFCNRNTGKSNIGLTNSRNYRTIRYQIKSSVYRTHKNYRLPRSLSLNIIPLAE